MSKIPIFEVPIEEGLDNLGEIKYFDTFSWSYHEKDLIKKCVSELVSRPSIDNTKKTVETSKGQISISFEVHKDTGEKIAIKGILKRSLLEEGNYSLNDLLFALIRKSMPDYGEDKEIVDKVIDSLEKRIGEIDPENIIMIFNSLIKILIKQCRKLKNPPMIENVLQAIIGGRMNIEKEKV